MLTKGLPSVFLALQGAQQSLCSAWLLQGFEDRKLRCAACSVVEIRVTVLVLALFGGKLAQAETLIQPPATLRIFFKILATRYKVYLAQLLLLCKDLYIL